ncbi:MAG: glycosyl transferase family 39 [Actinomycetia bacterium]|nr:glycosyl transferase family 39 [Actinomycetes bacterium]
MTAPPSLLARPPDTRWALRGSEGPWWVRPGLGLLLVCTAGLYLWGLGASGWANSFYSAAVQAGASSWKAFFFGSSDSANFITVDKTPAALWPMDLSARIFGVGTWSILVPQVLEGVATVGVLYATVRRSLSALGPAASAGAGLLAGAVLALTPVATLMFRFNNPDALLVLLLTLGAYGLVRAQQSGRTGALVFAASCVGTGFLAKMLQAFLVVPVFAVVYLVLAPVPVRRRLWQLVLAGVALVVSAGWWVAIVAIVPAADRPYIGGSQHNSVLELALGYNGLGRLTGNETGGLGNLNQDAGWSRIFGSELGGQISWLVPAALILLAAGLWITRAAVRTDPVRAALLLWGGWLLTTGIVFSFMQGIFHAYYSVALAPAVAALTGAGAMLVWSRGGTAGLRYWAANGTLASVVVVTGWWAQVLLGRTPDFQWWLQPVVLFGGLLAAGLLLVRQWLTRRMAGGVAIGAIALSLAGPAAYAVDTAGSGHSGAIPTAGPSTGGGPGGMGRMGGGGRTAGMGGGFGAGPGFGGGGGGQFANGGTGTRQPGTRGQGRPGGPGGMGGIGGPGGLLNATTPSTELSTLLVANSGSYTWVAATVGSNNAAGYQLATGRPVMAIGGFNGTDPAPSLAQFQKYVAKGRIHYFIGSGGMGGGGSSGSGVAQQIATWVAGHYTAKSVGGTTVYDLASGS